jgi:cytochrome c oxidase assembly protein subunit 15
MAFATYSLLLWTALDLLNPPTLAPPPLAPATLAAARSLRRLAKGNFVLVAATALSGAYVAGNDAGRAFNTFPLMGGQWVPQGMWELAPTWRNFFENTATVQFDHRLLAISSLSGISFMFFEAVRTKFSQAAPTFSLHSLRGVMVMAVTQVGLGITTLLLHVPVPLAAVHQVIHFLFSFYYYHYYSCFSLSLSCFLQAGSLVLLSLLTCLVHSLNFSKFGKITQPIQQIAISSVFKKFR